MVQQITDEQQVNEMQIDTSQMSKEKAQTLEIVEEARDQKWQGGSFTKDIFMGKLDFARVFPFPMQPQEDIDAGKPFLDKLEGVLKENVDADQIDIDGETPKETLKALADIGAFGIKIPKKYGGLGLSQTNYLLAGQMMGSWCGNITALVSAHQSIGVPQPLIMFGTEFQKEKYLTKCAGGEISAFALTELNAGSDPGDLQTSATLSNDGKNYIINGEKLWCTNSIVASVIVVVARSEDKIVAGKHRKQITAFIVDMDTPGITITHRCRFMGLRSLYNGVVNFKDVHVPVENVIGKEGRGLKVALETLNTGRLTMSGGCCGISKRCLKFSTDWGNARRQWGSSIGQHGAIADKIALMAAKTYAMEAMTMLAARMVDLKQVDIRLESAICKMKCSEDSTDIIDDTLQIRGGRGFETAQSLKVRGEEPVPIERIYRDCRINKIFEGSSEIMRLLIAREALDNHLAVGAKVMNTKLSIGARMKAAAGAAFFYAKWYPKLWLPSFSGDYGNLHPKLRKHMKRAQKETRRLARRMFHAMVKFGPKLELQHMLLKRFVDIGSELYVISATCSYAQAQHDQNPINQSYIEMADVYCKWSFGEIKKSFSGVSNNNDAQNYSVAQQVLDGSLDILSDGIVKE